MSRTSLLRSVIRGLLREEAGPGKSQELIAEIKWINGLLESAGVDAQVGILLRSAEGGITRVSFALGSRDNPGPDSVVKLDTQHTNIYNALSLVHSWSEKFDHISDRIQRLDASKDDSDLRRAVSEKISSLIPVGSIRIYPASEHRHNGSCAGAWTVAVTANTTKGWGPLLYDIALEWATMNSGVGLVSDRESVSPSAAGVWGIYSDPSRRPDVTPTQLDILKNSDGYREIVDELERERDETGMSSMEYRKRLRGIQLTPSDPSDDCSQDSSHVQMGSNWMKSPLSRAYRKSPTVISALQSAGLYWT